MAKRDKAVKREVESREEIETLLPSFDIGEKEIEKENESKPKKHKIFNKFYKEVKNVN